jgi:hypothetical protein
MSLKTTIGINSAQASADFLTISRGFALEVILTHQIISTKSTIAKQPLAIVVTRWGAFEELSRKSKQVHSWSDLS